MKNGKTFFWKLLVIGASLVILDRSIGALLAHYYFRITLGEWGRTTYVADSVNTPALILGSSRAEHGYIPRIITDSLHLDCYNTGRDKQGLLYALAAEKMIFRRYHPRAIILDLAPISFLAAESGLDDLAVLLPYYRPHPEIRPDLDKRSAWESLKTCSLLYCYNSLALQIARNNILDRTEDSTVNGYNPKFYTLNTPPIPLFTPQELSATPDTICVDAFRQIIKLAKDHNCKLAVVVSPVYYPLPHGSSTINLAREICGRQQVPFFDYTRSPAVCGHLPFFDDAQHLNDTGAQQFTRLLCTDLLAAGFPSATQR